MTSVADIVRCWRRSWTATRVRWECSSTSPTLWRRPAGPSTGTSPPVVSKGRRRLHRSRASWRGCLSVEVDYHDWDDEAAIRILTNCRTAMAPTGKVLLVEIVIPEGTAGSDATRMDPTMLVFTGSRERTEGEYRDLLHRAGLTLVKTTPTASQLSILEATPTQRGQR